MSDSLSKETYCEKHGVNLVQNDFCALCARELPSSNRVDTHPCPFCGCPRPPVACHLIRKDGKLVTDKHFVQCPNAVCGAQGPSCGSYEEAEAAWNLRALSANETNGYQTVIVGEYLEGGTVDLCKSKLPAGTKLFARLPLHSPRSLVEDAHTVGRQQPSKLHDAGSSPAGDAKHEYVDCPQGTGCSDCYGWAPDLRLCSGCRSNPCVCEELFKSQSSPEKPTERRCTCGEWPMREGFVRYEAGNTVHRLNGPCHQKEPEKAGCSGDKT